MKHLMKRAYVIILILLISVAFSKYAAASACTVNGAIDSDCDGLSDECERKLGTDPYNADSDGDGLTDGQEVSDHINCQMLPGDTNPLNPDTDGDHLSDGLEKKLGINPNNPDTDGDCISDSLELGLYPDDGSLAAASTVLKIHHADGSVTNSQPVVMNWSYVPGRDTDPLNPDTDGDGLCDGNQNVTNGGKNGNVNCIHGEDLNCNGRVDKAPKTGCDMETDPRLADTDGDGVVDKTDNCPLVYNPDQKDSNHDGVGDICRNYKSTTGCHAECNDNQCVQVPGSGSNSCTLGDHCFTTSCSQHHSANPKTPGYVIVTDNNNGQTQIYYDKCVAAQSYSGRLQIRSLIKYYCADNKMSYRASTCTHCSNGVCKPTK